MGDTSLVRRDWAEKPILEISKERICFAGGEPLQSEILNAEQSGKGYATFEINYRAGDGCHGRILIDRGGDTCLQGTHFSAAKSLSSFDHDGEDLPDGVERQPVCLVRLEEAERLEIETATQDAEDAVAH
ncbi:hypothetical protein LQ953_13345 [Sphingomonas sp. IC-56]|uniref:hypothetical protein n=1 Tax=Sphingomonas sp. IC-56 TaxID=2898529 RepID=UPI001E5523F0|nr:hypothetical protein [Sphingomonas sp. IC-56]MCD2325003.1 hypothetical protein [Sphingomonas sp. IC-56]